MSENLDLMASAILIWLPQGEEPDQESFDRQTIQHPPSPHSKPWRLLHEATTYASTQDHPEGKVPWIKTGSRMLTPDDIFQVYTDMDNLGVFQRGASPP